MIMHAAIISSELPEAFAVHVHKCLSDKVD